MDLLKDLSLALVIFQLQKGKVFRGTTVSNRKLKNLKLDQENIKKTL